MHLVVGLALFAALWLVAQPAAAQRASNVTSTAFEESVEGRSRPEYDPIGILIADVLGYQDRGIDPKSGLRLNAGVADTLIFYPNVGVAVGHNDNLTKTETNPVGDSFLQINPSIRLVTDWDNHELSTGVELDQRRYFSQTDEDWTDVKLRAGGRLDYSEWESFALNLTHSLLHEERGTFNRNFGSRPTQYSSTGAQLIWQYQRDQFLHRLVADATLLDYDDTDALAFSDRNQDDRDRWEYSITERLGYEAFDRTMVYVEPGVSWRRYRMTPDDFGNRRNSNGYSMLVGVEYDFSSLTSFDAAVGWMWRSYEDPNLRGYGGPTARARGLWNVTDVITLTGGIERTIAEKIDRNIGGSLDTSVFARVDWEYLYNTIFTAGIRRTLSETEGTGAVRGTTDVTYIYDLGFRHLLNEYVAIRGSWAMGTRESDVVGGDYRQNIWLLRLDFFI